MLIELLYFLTAATGTLFLLYILQPIAVRIGLVDRPKGHKKHQGEIPLVGGIAMFGGFWTTVLLFDIPCPSKLSFAIASTLLIIMGIWDDCRPLPAWIRLVAQSAAALVMIVGGEAVVENLGDILGYSEIVLERWLAVPFTMIAIVGVINAMNMIDGLDGVAGSLVALLLLCLVGLTVWDKLADQNIISLVLLATVVSFLGFNLPLFGKQAKLFMGDSGSMFLGLTAAWLLISLSQQPHNILAPVTALWLLAIPLVDTVNLLLRRLALGISPLSSNRDHLHHILLSVGYSSRQTLGIIISLASLFIGVGLLGKYLHLPQSFLFYGFMSLFIIYCYVTFYTWRKINLNFSQNIDEIKCSSHLLQAEFSGYAGRTDHSASSSSDGYKSMN